jgi:hypothetical protein
VNLVNHVQVGYPLLGKICHKKSGALAAPVLWMSRTKATKKIKDPISNRAPELTEFNFAGEIRGRADIPVRLQLQTAIKIATGQPFGV